MKLHARIEVSSVSALSKGGDSDLARRLRQVRTARHLSVRELARRAGCSASLVSQVERGVTTPSARIVYALSNELGISLDMLFGPGDVEEADLPATSASGEGALTGVTTGPSGSWGRATGPGGEGLVLRAKDRNAIELSTGIRWERLTAEHDSHVDFLEVVYEPFGRSSEDGRAVRHDGREYMLILEGEIEALIGFDTFALQAGDSLAFDPSTPHQYRNPTERQARGLSVVVHHRS